MSKASQNPNLSVYSFTRSENHFYAKVFFFAHSEEEAKELFVRAAFEGTINFLGTCLERKDPSLLRELVDKHYKVDTFSPTSGFISAEVLF